MRLFLLYNQTESVYFRNLSFDFEKTGPYFVDYIDPYAHKDMHTYTYTHTVHTQYTRCGTAWVWSSSGSALFSYLCSFHSSMHFLLKQNSIYPHGDSVEPSTLQKFLFCKHYATGFLLHVLFHLLDLKLRKRVYVLFWVFSVFLFGENEFMTMFTFLLLHKFCYAYWMLIIQLNQSLDSCRTRIKRWVPWSTLFRKDLQYVHTSSLSLAPTLTTVQ